MTQATIFSVPTTGPATPDVMYGRTDDNFRAALSGHSGPSRPSYAVAGTVWEDTAVAGSVKFYFYDGTNDILLYTVDTAANTVTLPSFTAGGAILDPTFAAAAAATKKLGFDLAAITAGQTRNIIMPDRNVDLSKVGILLHSTVATTSGTTIEFNSIPAGVRRIKVKQRNVRLSGTSQVLLQLGTASSFETTGYIAGITVSRDGSTTVSFNSAAGFVSSIGSTATVGTTVDVVIERLDGNEWTASLSGTVNNNGSAISQGVSGGGEKTLSGELTRLRLNTVNGTDTFSVGKATVLYEF